MESVGVKIRDGDGRLVGAVLHYTDKENPEMLLEIPGSEPIKVQDSDLFECLCRVREDLGKRGELILVQGARKDVFPSAMSREMANGKLAYVTKMGQQGRQEDIVDIFDFAEQHLIGTVAEQKAYHDEWIDSL